MLLVLNSYSFLAGYDKLTVMSNSRSYIQSLLWKGNCWMILKWQVFQLDICPLKVKLCGPPRDKQTKCTDALTVPIAIPGGITLAICTHFPQRCWMGFLLWVDQQCPEQCCFILAIICYGWTIEIFASHSNNNKLSKCRTTANVWN